VIVCALVSLLLLSYGFALGDLDLRMCDACGDKSALAILNRTQQKHGS
jgi:hypothetical protein